MYYSFQSRNSPTQLAAMATYYNLVQDQTYYEDSRATNHIRNELKNLSIHLGYQGSAKVPVCNGQGLQIFNSSSYC